MNKRLSCTNACILGWGWHPTQQSCLPTLSLATATCTPHWLLFQSRGPSHWGSSSHLILTASMTRAEVRLLVTDPTFCAAMTFLRALHSFFWRDKMQTCAGAQYQWHRHDSCPQPLPAGDMTGRVNSLLSEGLVQVALS